MVNLAEVNFFKLPPKKAELGAADPPVDPFRFSCIQNHVFTSMTCIIGGKKTRMNSSSFRDGAEFNIELTNIYTNMFLKNKNKFG